MYIQICKGKTAPAFAKKFYLEAKFLVTYRRLGLENAVTIALSSVAAHPHL